MGSRAGSGRDSSSWLLHLMPIFEHIFDKWSKGIVEDMATKVLLTGFEPFDGQQTNPSIEAVNRAAAALRQSGIDAISVHLPCVFGEAGDELLAEMNSHRPALIICVGQASGRAKISLERVAVNIDDAVIADNAGVQPVDRPVVDGGPVAYFSSLPLKACLAGLAARQIPAEVSQSAGTYVCNHVFYTLMHELAKQQGTAPPGAAAVRGGFVHIPASPQQAAGGRAVPAMEVTTAAAGIELIARHALGTREDLAVPAGAVH